MNVVADEHLYYELPPKMKCNLAAIKNIRVLIQGSYCFVKKKTGDFLYQRICNWIVNLHLAYICANEQNTTYYNISKNFID